MQREFKDFQMRILNEFFRPRRILSGGVRSSGENDTAGLSRSHGPSLSRRAGVSLVELMIALAILTIGIVSLMGTFSYIQKAVQLSKNRTLASNLAQEKMQILKQKSYYQVIVTTDPDHNTTDFAPDVLDFDTGYFPPENVTEAGVTYTRYTYVQLVKEDSGVLMDLAPHVPDTGMKRITVTVTWGVAGGKRRVTVRSILANPDTVLSNVIFSGTVKTTDTVPVALTGAVVQIAEGAGWSDTCDSSGQYTINATPGTYTLIASSTGYYSSLKTVVIAAGTSQTNNFNLRKIATGSIVGFPWLQDHLVISQVVGSTVNSSGYDQEYVEVFNPSTYSWTMGGQVGLKFQRAGDSAARTISIDYRLPAIDPGEFYLFANTGTVNAGGVVMPADAVWTSTNSTTFFPYFGTQANIIPVDDGTAPEIFNSEGGGSLMLYRISDGTAIDAVGWDKTGRPAPFDEGTAIQSNLGQGLSRNELYARITSTSDTAGVNSTYGPAYDSRNNSTDLYDYSSGISLPPHNSLVTAKPVISGTPAAGAVISCSDGLSASTAAVLMTNASLKSYAYFSLVNIATGSWSVMVSSGLYKLELSSVSVPNSGSIYTVPSTTTFLSQSNNQGIISGKVMNIYGNPLNGLIVKSSLGDVTNTCSDGVYRLRVSPGTVDVIVNPPGPGVGSTYVSASSNTIPIQAGQVHSGTDVVLYQGGVISGCITRDGTNGLPGVAVVIMDANSIARDQEVSDSAGRFTSVVLSTGYYVAQPAIGDLESSSPLSSTVTITTMGTNVFSSTFTISGALGYITGSVTKSSQIIKTGVLIVVTTATLTGTPPAPPDLSSATLTGTPFYLFSSMEDGTYKAEVRNGTGYSVYAYYPVAGSTGTTIYTANTTNVTVTAGATTSGVNFSW